MITEYRVMWRVGDDGWAEWDDACFSSFEAAKRSMRSGQEYAPGAEFMIESHQITEWQRADGP